MKRLGSNGPEIFLRTEIKNIFFRCLMGSREDSRSRSESESDDSDRSSTESTNEQQEEGERSPTPQKKSKKSKSHKKVHLKNCAQESTGRLIPMSRSSQ